MQTTSAHNIIYVGPTLEMNHVEPRNRACKTAIYNNLNKHADFGQTILAIDWQIYPLTFNWSK